MANAKLADDIGPRAGAVVKNALVALVELGFVPDQARAYLIHVADLGIESAAVAKSVASFCLETHLSFLEDAAGD